MATNENQSQKEFVISRTFDSPRDSVVKAFTQADSLKHWWEPKGLEFVKCTLDLRPGGMFHYCMRSPDGHEMWGKFVYHEIELPERMVFVNSFSDASGGTTRAPFNPNWPLEVRNLVTFTEDGAKTTITLRGAPINASDVEIEAFNSFFASMEQGFGGTFDQLEDYLKGE
jgi:uncharacterized protein YndB with AHSA1/START domain